MKILIASDKFKGSLASTEVCNAISAGLKEAYQNFQTEILPMSDGGDGLIEAIIYYTGASKISASVFDPLFRPINACFLISADLKTAIIEMAQASGLNLLRREEYDCASTSTYGTGQLIKKALGFGVEKIVLGIGGSATNDCGIGMAAALGYRFFDKMGEEVKPVGGSLAQIARIDASVDLKLTGVRIEVACDVTNPLTGPLGATTVYAPQKGASPQAVEELEAGMLNFAQVVKEDLGKDILTIKGGGAAGGTGAGAVAFLNADLRTGTDLIFDYSNFEEKLKGADLIITGEGKIDKQTLQGKLIQGITELCAKHRKPVIAFCGALELTSEEMERLGLRAAFSIMNKPLTLPQALEQAERLLQEAAFNVGQLIRLRA